MRYRGHKFQIINVEFLFRYMELLISSSHMVTYTVISVVYPTRFIVENTPSMFILIRPV